MHDPVDISPPMADPPPVAEIAEPHTDILSTTEEPVEMEESFTASPAQPEVSPALLEAPLESPSGPDQDLSVDLTESPEVETDPMSRPADVSNRPQSTLAESDGPSADQRISQQTNVLPLPPIYLKYPREADHSSLYPAEGPDRTSSQNDTSRSEGYKSCQLPRHKMDQLFGCSRI